MIRPKINLKLWLKRSALFKMISISRLCIVLIIVLGIFFSLFSIYQQVEPRLFQSNNHMLHLKIQNVSHSKVQKIQHYMPGIPIHNIESSLALVGLVNHVSHHKSNLQLDLGIFPKYSSQVLRDDSQFKIQFQAPSFLLLLQDITQSKQGKQLQKKALRFLNELKQEISNILPIITKYMQLYLAPYLDRMKTDKALQNILKQSLQKQLLAQIEWKQMVKDTFEASEMSEIQTQLFEDLNMWSVAYDAMTEGMKETWRLPSSFREWSWSSPIESWKRMSKKRTENQAKVKQKVVKTAIIHTGDQILENTQKNSESLKENALELAKKTNQKYQVTGKVKQWLQSLLTHTELKDHLINTYGQKAWQSFQDMLRAIFQEDKVQALYHTTSQKFKDLVEDTLKLILLDKAAQGPNPLLLLVIQERIKGQIRPSIHVTFGQGKVVPDAYEFEMTLH